MDHLAVQIALVVCLSSPVTSRNASSVAASKETKLGVFMFALLSNPDAAQEVLFGCGGCTMISVIAVIALIIGGVLLYKKMSQKKGS
jgi:hypothetical protein